MASASARRLQVAAEGRQRTLDGGARKAAGKGVAERLAALTEGSAQEVLEGRHFTLGQRRSVQAQADEGAVDLGWRHERAWPHDPQPRHARPRLGQHRE